MKDKEKIEEMAKVMCEDCIANQEMSCPITQTPCNWVESFAKTLYNAGYGKIDKDKVILTTKEYKMLEVAKNFYLDFRQRANYLKVCNEVKIARDERNKIVNKILEFVEKESEFLPDVHSDALLDRLVKFVKKI